MSSAENTLKEIDLYKRSIAAWGCESQITMLAEEAGELVVACLHLLRFNKNAKESWSNFAEEIADVEFMISELKWHFAGLADSVYTWREIKRDKLKQTLQEANK